MSTGGVATVAAAFRPITDSLLDTFVGLAGHGDNRNRTGKTAIRHRRSLFLRGSLG